MKKTIFAPLVPVFVLVLAFGAGPALSAEHGAHNHGHGGSAPAQSAQAYSADGVVVDVSGLTLVITHAPIPALGWPAMTMRFTAESAELLEGVKAGDKISFDFRPQGRDYVIVGLEVL
jgi:Cu(I)/Ag(I) efflux system protein CusF